jgi:hypothetical protein
VISIIDLVNAMTTTLQNIPELVALLDQGAASVVGYIDENPTRNASFKAVYKMPGGSLLVIWQGTTLEPATDMRWSWNHVMQVFVKARRGDSALAILDALVDGVPVPGDGQRWRFCPIMDGVLPTNVQELSRMIDEEGIDYFVVTTATQETGDD